MVQTIQAQAVDLRFLIDNFDLQFVDDSQFFCEWQENLPEISEGDRRQLDKVRAGFVNLLNYPPLLENVIKMAVLDPLLFIGNFYLSPFSIKSEESVEIFTEDEGIIIKGRIDTLVLKDQFWVMVIESKRAAYSVEAGLGQLLAYMLANPHPHQPCYGMITGGGTFIFIKLVQEPRPQYGTSKVFATRNPGDLHEVLKILKQLSNLVVNS